MEVNELVCLDNFLTQDDENARKFGNDLRGISRNCLFLNNENECERRINESNKKIVLLISGSFGESFIKKIHDNSKIISIAVFCQDVATHQNLLKFTKVEAVSKHFREIREILYTQLNPFQLGLIPISFLPEAKFDSQSLSLANNKILTFTRLLKKAVSTMPHPGDDEKDLLVKLLSQNETNDREFRKFEQEYRFPDAMNYYHKDSFIFNYLNKNLRNLKFSSIVDMGFYIHAMQQGIGFRERENREKFQPNQFILSFSESITEQTFFMLSTNINKLLSTNSFLITNGDERTTLAAYQKLQVEKPKRIPVFFRIFTSRNPKLTPFAEIGHASDETQRQFIFRMQTIFVIREVKQGDRNSPNEVHLTIADEEETNFKDIFRSIDSKTSGSGWNRVKISLSYIYREIFGSNLVLEEQRTDPKARVNDAQEKVSAYEILAQMKDKELKSAMALVYYAELLRLYRSSLPSLDHKLCLTLIKIGEFQESMRRFEEALKYSEEAHSILTQTLPSHHIRLGDSHERLGRLYENLGRKSEASNQYQKAFSIKEQNSRTDPAKLKELQESINRVGSRF